MADIKLYANGKFLKQQREKLTLSQGEIATLLSLKRGYQMTEALYQKIEQGARSVDLPTAKIISQLVGLEIGILFYFKERSNVKFANQL